jgi:hypothetical protein
MGRGALILNGRTRCWHAGSPDVPHKVPDEGGGR